MPSPIAQGQATIAATAHRPTAESESVRQKASATMLTAASAERPLAMTKEEKESGVVLFVI